MISPAPAPIPPSNLDTIVPKLPTRDDRLRYLGVLDAIISRYLRRIDQTNQLRDFTPTGKAN